MASLNFTEEDWLSCCGSSKFAKGMAKLGPFQSIPEAIDMSREIWWNKVDVPGWLEAFAAHPRIGDIKALSSKATTNPEWCEGEQAAALQSADDRALKDLATWNRQYEAKFGFVFLVCATGKSSSEILELLKGRMSNRPYVELSVAANEQQKITELRLSKLVTEKSVDRNSIHTSIPPPLQRANTPGTFRTGDTVVDGRLNKLEAHVKAPAAQTTAAAAAALRPPITTHVLDVALGKPAAGVEVSLELLKDHGVWHLVGESCTNADGRAGALMQASLQVEPGQYRITFKTGKYLLATQQHLEKPFYPAVSIVFQILPSQTLQHFHVPLLLSPFSFTTYRGS